MIKNKNIIFQLLPFFKPYIKLQCIGYMCIGISTILSLLLPLYVQQVIENILEVKWESIVKVVLFLLGALLFDTLSTYILNIAGQKVVRDIRLNLWEKLLRMETKYFDETHSGSISSRLINDTSIIVTFISTDIPRLISGICIILGSVSIMFSLDNVMTIVFLCLIPTIAFTIKPISSRMYLLSEEQQNILARLNSFFTEIISQNRLIKAYNAEKFEKKRGTKHIDDFFEFSKKVAKLQAILTPIMGGIMSVLIISVIGTGAYRVSTGQITIGILVAFVLYFVEVTEPIQSIGNFIIEGEVIRGASKEIFALLNNDKELNAKDDIMLSEQKQGNIIFENVSFGYNKSDLILKDINFEIKKGEKVAIVGESGAGKTTLISLLERFYRPDEGVIRYGGTDIESFPLYSWRSLFSYVSQDNAIVSGSIKDNILYGNDKENSEEEIDKVLGNSNLREFIQGLPNGINTVVGERGNLISGGEKQRIAIARALLRNTDYLLMDEAMANLDSISEQMIQEALDILTIGKTSIIIAHKLKTIMNADRILVIDEGGIIGNGTHENLIANNEFYQKLIRHQFNGGGNYESCKSI